MTLAELIRQNNWQGLTAAQIADAANAATVEVRDDQQYTWAGVALLVGPANAEALRQALDANGLGWAVHQLGGSGLQLSHPGTVAMLDGFIAGGLTFCQVLKEKGISYVTPAQQAGLPPVTEQAAQAALDEVLRSDQKQEWRQRFDTILNQLDTAEHQQGLDALAVLVAEIS